MGRIRTTTGNIAYAKYQLKRSIIESTLDDNYTENDHKDALEFFGGCAYCGSKNTSRMDHLVPVFKLGDFIRSNVVPACQECDDSKGQKDYQDWMRNSTSPKSLRNRGFSEEESERRIRIIEKWQGSYRARSEKQLFGLHYDQYKEILNKMDHLCNEARQLVRNVNPQVTRKAEENVGAPSFSDVFDCLRRHGPATCVSSRNTIYNIRAEITAGRPTIIACPRTGEVRIHEDCWGQQVTCQKSRAGGIYNGEPSIYDWYTKNCN